MNVRFDRQKQTLVCVSCGAGMRLRAGRGVAQIASALLSGGRFEAIQRFYAEHEHRANFVRREAP